MFRQYEVSHKAEMIARPDSIDRILEDLGTSFYIQSLASVRSKADEDVVNSSKRPIPEWTHALNHFVHDHGVGWSEGVPRILRMGALPGVAIAYAQISQRLAAGPEPYAGGIPVRVEISNNDYLPEGMLNLFLDESGRNYGLKLAFAFKVQLPMRKMVDEQECAHGIWRLHFCD